VIAFVRQMPKISVNSFQYGRQGHALYGHLGRCDVLREAWRRVTKNRGAAAVDGQAIRDVEQYGVECFLEALGAVLQAGEYLATVVTAAGRTSHE
jgi:RNA-directed DNA polymerase